MSTQKASFSVPARPREGSVYLASSPYLLAGALAFLTLALAPSQASAQWTPVTTGIDYQDFTLSNPNNRVFVARMHRSEPSVTIDSMIAQGRLSGGRETVSDMVSRYNETIGYWGQEWGGRNDVVVAINGHFFDLTSGVPEPGQIVSGWYAWSYGNMGGLSGFAWTLNRDAFIGECVTHRPDRNFISLPGDLHVEIDGVNSDRGSDALVVFTTHYDAATPPQGSGVEILVEMSRPAMVLPTPSKAEGTVAAIFPDQGSTYLPFDHVVLSASGSKATTLLANVSLGDTIGISQEISSYHHDCNTPDSVDWTKTYASVGGNFHFLSEGVVQSSTDPGATTRNPRTAVALNDDYVYFIVVDGRTSTSVGMSTTELGNFCLDYLDAVEGVNQDGGGSSAMWVDGQIRNNPSDGTERTVANGLMMVRVLPKELSQAFHPGDTVAARTNASMRLGPGTNYAERGQISSGQQALVMPHTVAGVLAKGAHWWRIDSGSVMGWVDESSLDLVAHGPDSGVGPNQDGGAVSDAQIAGDSGVPIDGGKGLKGNATGGCRCNLGPREAGGRGAVALLFLLLALAVLLRPAGSRRSSFLP